MYQYKTLFDITSRPPDTETIEVIADLPELGVQPAFLEEERARACSCRMFTISGPEQRDRRTGTRHRPHWLL